MFHFRKVAKSGVSHISDQFSQSVVGAERAEVQQTLKPDNVSMASYFLAAMS